MGKIDITSVKICDLYLPEGFDKTKILHVSDLHSANFGKNQSTIIEKSKELKPDYVFITGDLIDRKSKKIAPILEYVLKLKKIAPVFCITGNHEWQAGKSGRKLLDILQDQGITILHDRATTLQKNGDVITLLGIDDPYCYNPKADMEYDRIRAKKFIERLVRLSKDKFSAYTILLSHRPEFFYFYKRVNINLVFSGHAHGGQFRIPKLGGVLAPHQGFFPKYSEGVISEEKTTMIVSRGLGNSTFPIRINNSPELVLVTLATDSFKERSWK